MKVLFPRHIKKWIFATMSFRIWPITVDIIQLFILAIGVAGSFAVANYFMQQWQPRFVAIAVAAPLTLIAVAIAFFQVSEMGLIEFIAKMLRTHFFDTTTKYQVNTNKEDNINLLIKEIHSEETTQKIQFKTAKWLLSDNDHDKIRESGLL